MGEQSIAEVADALAGGLAVSDITFVPGTCFKTKDPQAASEAVELPSWEQLQSDPKEYAKSFAVQYRNTDPFHAKRLAERYDTVWVVQNPPAKPLTTMEMDDIYALPYQRRAHPMYDSMGGVSALEEVKFSLVSCRGCFGGCSFCALTCEGSVPGQAVPFPGTLPESAGRSQ